MSSTFLPPRRTGLIFHVIAIGLFSLGSAFSLERANSSEIGLDFLLDVTLFIGLALPVPVLLYRVYSLFRSGYTLSPDGISLWWGLRAVDISIHEVSWVASRGGLPDLPPLPRVRWTGSVMGVRRHDGQEVEYMASRSSGLVYVASGDRLYGISPLKPETFLATYRSYAEKGSLSPLETRSVYPARVLQYVWQAVPARVLIIAGFVLSAVFLLFITTAFSLQAAVTGPPLTPTQLALLPILNGIFYLVDLLLGLFMFRRDETRMLAYMLWGTSVITSVLFFAIAMGSY